MRMRFGALALLAVVAALGLIVAGCGDDDDDEGTTAATTTEETTTEDATTTTEEDDGAGGAAAGDDSAGQEIFASNCATCHGAEGEGGSGPPLQGNSFAADFDNVVEQVTNGGGGMPPFGDVLSEQEINDVATYVSDELADED